MTGAPVVRGVLLVVLTAVVAAEALMGGVSLAAARRPRAAPWRVLGPLPLLATVWLVVLVAWVQVGFPTTESAVWTDAWIAAGSAVLAAAARLALVLLGPLLPERAGGGTRLAIAATGVVALTAWPVLAVQVGRLAAGQVAGGAAVVAVLAVVAGRAVAGPSDGAADGSADGAADGAADGLERGRGVRLRAARAVPAAAGAVGVVLVGLALVPVPVLTPSADRATLRLLAVAGIVTLPVLTGLQVLAVRGLRAAGPAADWTRRLPPTAAPGPGARASGPGARVPHTTGGPRP